MPWYAYHRGGWQIAVDAMNQRDAARLMAREVPDAVYDGEFTPIKMASGYSAATAFVTPRRQEQISENIRQQDEKIMREYPHLLTKEQQ